MDVNKDIIVSSAPALQLPMFESSQKLIAKLFNERIESALDGEVLIGDVRHLLISASALVHSLDAVVRALNISESEEDIKYNVGRQLGAIDARRLRKSLSMKDPMEALVAGPAYFAYSGWATVVIHTIGNQEPAPSYWSVFDHENSAEVSHSENDVIVSGVCQCDLSAGYASGWTSECFGFPVTAVEVYCRGRGDDTCRFVMAPPETIEEHIKELEERPLFMIVPMSYKKMPKIF